ncbi:MAG: hypothetical protein QOE54_2010 [Streptosporangiaceae bacterium]|nr:hypothetical protein [Streptosporangiaceae bacterium]MDX6429644.1 hypothetical protein [Streptosporangiaceae bacterium]
MGDDVNAQAAPEQLPYGPDGSHGSDDLGPEPVPVRKRTPNPRVQAFVTGAAYGGLAVAGLMLGVIESFSYSWSAGSIPLAAILWSLFNLVALWGAGRGMGGKLGAAVPALMWLAVVMVLAVQRPEGDLVVTGTAAGTIFLYGGVLAGGIALLLAPSSGEWLLGAAGRDRRG